MALIFVFSSQQDHCGLLGVPSFCATGWNVTPGRKRGKHVGFTLFVYLPLGFTVLGCLFFSVFKHLFVLFSFQIVLGAGQIRYYLIHHGWKQKSNPLILPRKTFSKNILDPYKSINLSFFNCCCCSLIWTRCWKCLLSCSCSINIS